MGAWSWPVGGRAPLYSDRATLMTPAKPAAHVVCPISDLTEAEGAAAGMAPDGEQFRERLQLGPVPRRRSRYRALRPTRPGRGRRRPCGRPVPAPGAAPRVGCCQPQAPAVAGAGDGLHDGVYPVAVALGVGQALQDHAGDTLAQRDPVGAGSNERQRPVGDSACTEATARSPAVRCVRRRRRRGPCRWYRPQFLATLRPGRPATTRRRRRRCSWCPLDLLPTIGSDRARAGNRGRSEGALRCRARPCRNRGAGIAGLLANMEPTVG